MFLGITPFSQSNYITTLSKPQKVNFSLQNHFGDQPQDTFTLQKNEFNEVEKQQYNEILNTLPIQNKKELENLQKNGILLNKKSNNNSSTLDNLYKIYKTERAEGLNNKEIAQALFLSEGTVRNYLSSTLEKLDVRDRTQLAIYYYKHVQ